MYIVKSQQNSGSHKFISAGDNKLVDQIIYFCWSQQIGGSHKFISAPFNKTVDPINLFLLTSTKYGFFNLFLLESTKTWMYFCSNNIFSKRLTWCFHITIKSHCLPRLLHIPFIKDGEEWWGHQQEQKRTICSATSRHDDFGREGEVGSLRKNSILDSRYKIALNVAP